GEPAFLRERGNDRFWFLFRPNQDTLLSREWYDFHSRFLRFRLAAFEFPLGLCHRLLQGLRSGPRDFEAGRFTRWPRQHEIRGLALRDLKGISQQPVGSQREQVEPKRVPLLIIVLTSCRAAWYRANTAPELLNIVERVHFPQVLHFS